MLEHWCYVLEVVVVTLKTFFEFSSFVIIQKMFVDDI